MSTKAATEGTSNAATTDLLTLKVICSSVLGDIPSSTLQDFTRYLTNTLPGEKFQWSFIIPLKQDTSTTQNGGCITTNSGIISTASNNSIYDGPECCITIPSVSTSGVGWPERVTNKTVPTIFAELLLLGSSLSNDDRLALQQNVVDAITRYLCPSEQKVWVTVTYRQLTGVDYICCGVMNA